MTADSNVLSFPPPRSTPSSNVGDEALLGPSPAIARVWSQIRRVAPHFRAAVVNGEPGTGAEAVARSLHALSPVAQMPFAVLDQDRAELLLAAPASAIQPELEGTLFLADVTRLSGPAQRGLTRKLRARPRFRVVAASATELRASVSADRFSAELAELLGTVRIVLPPLRERTEDVPLLATHLVHRLAESLKLRTPSLSPTFHDAAMEHGWPGNIDQLEQAVHYLLTHTEDDTYNAALLTRAIEKTSTPPSIVRPATRMICLEDVAQEHIRAVLIGCDGNKLRAAEVLGISRSTLYRMLDGGVANRHYSMAG